MKKLRKLANVGLYVIAAGFLAWHLAPVGNLLAQYKPSQSTNEQLAADAQCTNGNLDELTYGDPLHDPLYASLEDAPRVVREFPGGVNVIKNPQALELDAERQQVGWTNDSYGQNAATFSITQKATPKSNAFRIDMKNYQNGDAKWLMSPISVTSGQMVAFNVQYRTDQNTDIVVAFIRADGSRQYVDVAHLPRTKNNAWEIYQGNVVIPENVTGAQLTQVISSNGYLETTNYRAVIRPAVGFSRGLVSVTFDDGWESIYEKGLPLFKKYSIPTTQFIVASYDKNSAYMTRTQIQALQDNGQEIGSHSYSHPKLTEQDTAGLNTQLAGSQAILQAHYTGSANNFAAPFGLYNERVTNSIKQCYQSHRTTDTGYNAAGYDRYHVRVQNVEVNTTPEQVKSWVDFAQRNKLWLVLVYHQVEDGGSYSVDSGVLEAQLKAIKDSNIHIASYNDALVETYSQHRDLAPYSGF